jgi:hypothetical protein
LATTSNKRCILEGGEDILLAWCKSAGAEGWPKKMVPSTVGGIEIPALRNKLHVDFILLLASLFNSVRLPSPLGTSVERGDSADRSRFIRRLSAICRPTTSSSGPEFVNPSESLYNYLETTTNK